MSWVVRWLLKGCTEMIASVFDLVKDISTVGFTNEIIVALLSAFKTLGLSVLAISLLSLLFKQILNIMDGQQINIGSTFQRMIIGCVAYEYGVKIMQELYILMLEYGQKILSAITKVDIEFDFSIDGLPIMLALVLVVVAIFYMLKNIINLIERFWLYSLTLLLLYLYIPGYVMGNDEGIIIWFKQCVAIAITQVFQTLILIAGMLMFAQKGSVGDFLLCIGAIIAASKTDQVLDKWGYNAGGKIGNLARNGMSTAFYARNILKH